MREIPAAPIIGVDFLEEEVHDLAEDHAARGVEDERHEAEGKDHQRPECEERARLHVGGNGGGQA